MNSGISGPWQARVALFAFGQIGLAVSQVLAYKQDGGVWVTLGIAGMQFLAAISAAFGPGAAGLLAKKVGSAVAEGKGEREPPKAEGA